MTVRVQPPEPEETGVADGGDEHKSRKRAPGRWRVHVETRLPSLGPVTLDVALGKRYTRLDVRADDPIASLLASQKEALDARLSEMRIGRTYVSIQPNDAKGRRRVR